MIKLRRGLKGIFSARLAGRLKQEQGIGLAETLVAVSILAIALAGFMTALSTGMLAIGVQDEQTVAYRLAETQIETIKAATYDASGASYAAVAAPGGYTLTKAINSSLYGNTDIQKITVNVMRGANTILTLEDYKVNR